MTDFVMRLIGQDETKAATDSAKGNLTGLNQAADSVKQALAGMAAGLTAGAFATMIKGSIDAGVKLTELSARVGVGIEALSQYKYVAEANSISLDTLTGAFQKMQVNLSKASEGTGAAADALKLLGLSTTDLASLEPDAQFEAIADALSKVGNKSDQTRLAMQLFGKAGAQLLPIMEEGAAGLSEMRAEADRLGLTISKDTAAKLSAFDDTMDRLGAQAEGLKNTMAVALLPSLQDIATAFEETGAQTDSFEVAMEAVGGVLKGVAFAGVAVVEGISLVGKTLGAIAAEAVAIASGDFAMAAQISKENAADEERTAAKLAETYRNLFEAKQQAANDPVVSPAAPAASPAANPTTSIFADAEAHKANLEAKADADKAYYDQVSEMWMAQIEAEQEAQSQRIATSQETAAAIYEATRTPMEQFQKDYEELYDLYQQGYFDKLGGEETFLRYSQELNQKRLAEEKRAANERLAFEKMSLRQKADLIQKSGLEIISIISAGNQEVFRQNKALAMAQGLLNAYGAIMKAYDFGAGIGGPYVGAAFAALAAVAQFKTLQSIASADYGKSATGGGPGTYGGSAGGAAISTPIDMATSANDSTATAAAPVKNVYIAIEGGDGALLTGQQVRRLIEQINEEAGNNVRIVA